MKTSWRSMTSLNGEKIKENKTVKDLEMFTEHIDDLVQLSKIKVGLLPRTFETKKPGQW